MADHVVIDPSVLYVGTPTFLLGTSNPDGSANLAPASSYWALGKTVVLGIELDGQSALNLAARPGVTVNFPSGALWRAVHSLAYVTGRDPVPEAKSARYTHVADKFAHAGLTPQPSELVAAPRVAECLLQFEAAVRRTTPGLDGGYLIVEAEVIRVHAHPDILKPGTEIVDPNRWDPLVYSFRHFYSRGTELGWLPSSPTAEGAPPL